MTRVLIDSNVAQAAARGNELAQQALEMSGARETGSEAMTAIAVDVAEELFQQFSEEAGVVCEAVEQPAELSEAA